MSKFIYSGFGDEIASDLETQLRVMKDLGIYALEIRRVNEIPIAQQTREAVEEIKRQLDANGFEISAMGSAIGKIRVDEDFDAHMREFERIMAYAEILGTNRIRMFSFYIPEGANPDDFTDEVLRRLEALLRAAEKRNMYLYLENEKALYGNIARRSELIMKRLYSDHFKTAFDPANYVQEGQATYPEAWEMLKKYTAHMHVKDALFADKSVQVVGEGDGCLREILTDLYHSDYQGYLVLEPHISDFAGHVSSTATDSPYKNGPVGFRHAANTLFQMLDEIRK